jgi:5-methylcytosine-specific restriction endonuclease McrA
MGHKEAGGRRDQGSRASVQQVIKYAIQKSIRQVYSRYHEGKKKALESSKVKVYPKKADGTQSKQYRVFYHCASCQQLVAEVDVDHIIPVGRFPQWPFGRGELEDWITRLFCDVENLQVLCKPCHKLKCKEERANGVY